MPMRKTLTRLIYQRRASRRCSGSALWKTLRQRKEADRHFSAFAGERTRGNGFEEQRVEPKINTKNCPASAFLRPGTLRVGTDSSLKKKSLPGVVLPTHEPKKT